MTITSQPVITGADRAQLREMLRMHLDFLHSPNRQMTLLAEKLDRAGIESSLDIPPWVVTMHLTALLRSPDRRRHATLSLVFPQEGALSRNRLSVLTPLGTELLGASEGDWLTAEYCDGVRRWQVTKVLYQPESARRIGHSDSRFVRERYHTGSPSAEGPEQKVLISQVKEGRDL